MSTMAPRRRNPGGGSSSQASTSAQTPGPQEAGRRTSRAAGDDTPGMARRQSRNTPPSEAEDSPGEGHHRRDSTFSGYGDIVTDAKETVQDEILFPGTPTDDTATWKSKLPIMFTLLPPIIGLFVANGARFANDCILFLLSTLCLHWSCSMPWSWYHNAQRHRIKHDAVYEESLDVGGNNGPGDDGSEPGSSPLSPEEKQKRIHIIAAARTRLRTFELMALASTFVAPMVAVYFLYRVREILVWPGEGLFSDINLGIVLLVCEVGPVTHAMKLILLYTLNLQTIVSNDPYKMVRVTPTRYNALLERITELEQQALEQPDVNSPSWRRAFIKELGDEVTRNVRASIKPDLDDVVRAVKRREKSIGALEKDMAAVQTDVAGLKANVAALEKGLSQQQKEMKQCWKQVDRQFDQQRADVRRLKRYLDDAVEASNAPVEPGLIGGLIRKGVEIATLPLTVSVWMGSVFFMPVTMPLNWLMENGRRLLAEGRFQGNVQALGAGAQGRVQGRVRMEEPEGRGRGSRAITYRSRSRSRSGSRDS